MARRSPPWLGHYAARLGRDHRALSTVHSIIQRNPLCHKDACPRIALISANDSWLIVPRKHQLISDSREYASVRCTSQEATLFHSRIIRGRIFRALRHPRDLTNRRLLLNKTIGTTRNMVEERTAVSISQVRRLTVGQRQN